MNIIGVSSNSGTRSPWLVPITGRKARNSVFTLKHLELIGRGERGSRAPTNKQGRKSGGQMLPGKAVYFYDYTNVTMQRVFIHCLVFSSEELLGVVTHPCESYLQPFQPVCQFSVPRCVTSMLLNSKCSKNNQC